MQHSQSQSVLEIREIPVVKAKITKLMFQALTFRQSEFEELILAAVIWPVYHILVFDFPADTASHAVSLGTKPFIYFEESVIDLLPTLITVLILFS